MEWKNEPPIDPRDNLMPKILAEITDKETGKTLSVIFYSGDFSWLESKLLVEKDNRPASIEDIKSCALDLTTVGTEFLAGGNAYAVVNTIINNPSYTVDLLPDGSVPNRTHKDFLKAMCFTRNEVEYITLYILPKFELFE